MKKMLMIITFLLLSTGSFAGGKDFFAANCAGCHGATAQGQGMFPKLAGKKADFIAAELAKFKSKKRKAAFAIPIKDSMTAAQAKEVAAFIATLK
jgi:cytochrome c553